MNQDLLDLLRLELKLREDYLNDSDKIISNLKKILSRDCTHPEDFIQTFYTHDGTTNGIKYFHNPVCTICDFIKADNGDWVSQEIPF